MIEKGGLLRETGLTERQLGEWVRRGLLPKPELERLGRGKGVRSCYSDDCLERIEIIKEALRQRHDLDYALLALWRSGYDVPIRPLFDRSIEILRDLQKRTLGGDLTSEEAFNVQEQAASGRIWPPLVRQAHRRVGSKNWETFIHLIFAAHILPDDPSEDEKHEDTAVFRKGIGILSRIVPAETSVYHILLEVRPHLDPDNLQEMLANSNETRLIQADTECQRLLLIINAFYNSYRLLSSQGVKPLFQF